MIAATLFSGIGAPEAAMPGWHWPWHAEVERFPNAVMAARHPRSANLGDVSRDDFAERAAAIARPDVLVFGSPCQSFSVAGRRLGLDDPRGNLAIVALRVVERLRPRWFVFENVPGLLSLDDGRAFGALLGLVGELGYGFVYRVLDAQYFGVPQRRRRVFVVGHSRDWRRAAAVLFEPESLRGDPAPGREARQAIASGIGAGSNRSGGRIGRCEAAGNQLIAYGGNNTAGSIDIATARNGHAEPHGRLDFETETFVVADPISANEARTYTHEGTHNFRLRNVVPVAFGLRSDAARDGTAKTPSADAEGRVRLRDPGFNAYEELAPTVDGSGAHSVGIASAVRRLTPRECERLQGFPDDYTLIDYRCRPAADGPRYKALGNSMAVPVVRWILARIERCEAIP